MTSDEFYLGRLADLYDFFRLTFKGRWTIHIRKKLGHTCLDALMPSRRREKKLISLKVMKELETYAAQLGFKGLSSELADREEVSGRCPWCHGQMRLTFSKPASHGVLHQSHQLAQVTSTTATNTA